MPWLGLVSVGISVDIYVMVGYVVMVREHVYIYAMVGIVVSSGNRRSGKQRSGKRRSAIEIRNFLISLRDWLNPLKLLYFCCTKYSFDLKSIQKSLNNGTLHFPYLNLSGVSCYKV